MNNLLYILTFTLFFSGISIDNINNGKQINVNDEIFSVNDTTWQMIHLNMDLKDMNNALGEPLKKEAHFEGTFGEDILEYYYDFGKVRLEPKGNENNDYYLSTIDITNDKYAGPRGTKIGDSYKNIIDKFPVMSVKPIDSVYLTKSLYEISEDTCGKVFYNENGKITSIKYSFTDLETSDDSIMGCYLNFNIKDDILRSISLGLLYTH